MDACLNIQPSRSYKSVFCDMYNSSDGNISPESMSAEISEFNPLKSEIHLNNIKNTFLPSQKNITSPFQSPIGECHLEK
jgi:hypothetical protein